MKKTIVVTLFLFFLSLFASLGCALAFADKYLYEYGMELYREGNIDEAIQSLKKALLANPSNVEARAQLKKILGYLESHEEPQQARDDSSEKIAKLNSQIAEISAQKQQYQELMQKKEEELRYGVGKEKEKIELFKSEVARLQKERETDVQRLAVLQDEKNKMLQLNSQVEELTLQKQKYQELVQKKEGELRFSEGREKGNIEQLKSEVERLQKERENDEERLTALQNEKCKTLQLASQITQLSNEKQQRNEEIAQKGKALSDLKANYESRINGLRALLRQQEQKIDALSLDKRALLEENMRIEREQLAEIERLISMIEAGGGVKMLD